MWIHDAAADSYLLTGARLSRATCVTLVACGLLAAAGWALNQYLASPWMQGQVSVVTGSLTATWVLVRRWLDCPDDPVAGGAAAGLSGLAAAAGTLL